MQDGCVTASARAIIPHLGINFEEEFLPRLREFSLDQNNPENNHMLGIAIVAADMGYSTEIHQVTPLELLPENAPASAKNMHSNVLEQIFELANQGRITLTNERLDKKTLEEKLLSNLRDGSYALAILDWKKWNSTVQKQYGNPRHIVAIFALEEQKIKIIDPSLKENDNPVEETIEKLLESFDEKQRLIFVGRKVS